MASSVEDTLIKLDKCHSVDYNNDEVKLIKSKIEAIVHDISTRIGASNPILFQIPLFNVVVFITIAKSLLLMNLISFWF